MMSSDKGSPERELLLERDFPQEYGAIRAILSKVAPSAIAEENDQLRSELIEIVSGYGRDRSRSEYRNEAAELADKTKVLIDTLNSVLQMIENLDSTYTRRMADFMSKVSLELGPHYSWGYVVGDLEKAQLAASYFRLAIHLATHFEARPSGRSRPPLPQFVPTVQLMDLWERLTGKEIVSPKGVAAGKGKPEPAQPSEAVQPSTEFVRLGLKMIDPKITVANTITLMKRALRERRESQLKTFVDLIKMPEWGDIVEGFKRWQETEGVTPSNET